MHTSSSLNPLRPYPSPLPSPLPPLPCAAPVAEAPVDIVAQEDESDWRKDVFAKVDSEGKETHYITMYMS